MAQVNSQSQSGSSSYNGPPFLGVPGPIREANALDENNRGPHGGQNVAGSTRSRARVYADNRSNAQGQAQVTTANWEYDYQLWRPPIPV